MRNIFSLNKEDSMMQQDFWKSGTGAEITGNPKDAFMPDFEVIPNNTKVLASIKSFELVLKAESQYAKAQKYYEIIWEIRGPNFKDRVVTQKIKPFFAKPEQVDRALNMLKLIFNICDVGTPNFEPDNAFLRSLNGKILGIKIRQYHIPKADGSGLIEGNFVSEVYNPHGFEPAIGELVEPKLKPSNAYGQAVQPQNVQTLTNQLDSDAPF